MKSRSVNVLNEADAFDLKLRWILFKAENEEALRQHRPDWWDGPLPTDSTGRHMYHRMHGTDEHPEVWTPGVPLYRRPWGASYEEQTVDYMVDSYAEFLDTEADEDGEERETMEDVITLALISVGHFMGNYCVPCEVAWSKRDAPCWVCGEPGQRPASKQLLVSNRFDERQLMVYAEVDAGMTQEQFYLYRRLFDREILTGVGNQADRNARVPQYRPGEPIDFTPAPPEQNRVFISTDLVAGDVEERNEHSGFPISFDVEEMRNGSRVRLYTVIGRQAGRGQMTRFVMDEWVGSHPVTEPEPTVSNGIRLPEGVDFDGDTTKTVPTPEVNLSNSVLRRSLEERRYPTSRPDWDRRRR